MPQNSYKVLQPKLPIHNHSRREKLLTSFCTVFLEKIIKALPDADDLAKLLPDFDKIGESFASLKGFFSPGENNFSAQF